ncbi:YIP1 family protein [Candidatus Woesearchaeota archaeon]|nr:YIP1 family protein [Candidatus Woesearchaeota archaeon]
MAKEELLAYIRRSRAQGYAPSQISAALAKAGYSSSQIEQAIADALRPPVAARPQKIGYFRRLKLALFSPRQLFEHAKTEGIKRAFGFLVVTLLFFILIYGGLLLLAGSVLSAMLSLFLPFDISLISFSVLGIALAAVFLGFVVFSFVGAAVLHPFVKLFRGTGKYSATYAAIAYSTAPLLFLFLLPVVGIWQFIVLIFGLSITHGIPKARAFFALLLEGLFIGALAFFASMALVPLDASLSSLGDSAQALLGETGGTGADAGDAECVFDDARGDWCIPEEADRCFRTQIECKAALKNPS